MRLFLLPTLALCSVEELDETHENLFGLQLVPYERELPGWSMLKLIEPPLRGSSNLFALDVSPDKVFERFMLDADLVKQIEAAVADKENADVSQLKALDERLRQQSDLLFEHFKRAHALEAGYLLDQMPKLRELQELLFKLIKDVILKNVS
jgi:hypothetical protein